MIKFILSLFAWRFAFSAGVYDYYENAVTGGRMYRRAFTGGHSPLAWEWLNREPERVPVPPRGGSGVVRGR